LKPRSLLVIGAGRMQVPVVEVAKAMGLVVLVMDRNPEAPAMALADHRIMADISDLPGAVAATEVFAKAHFIPDGALTVGTDFPTTSAAIAERFKLPGISMDTARSAKDKLLMRERFAAHHCSQPRFVGVLSESDLDRAVAEVGFPMVVKPTDSMGARGVRRVDDLPTLKTAWLDAKGFSPTGRVIAETFIPGEELSLDAVAWKGDIKIRGIADRIIERPPYFIETGHILPSRLSPGVLKNACAVFEAGIRALGIESGWAKGDIRVNPEGAFIGEIAARLSGGFMSGYTYPYASGVNLLEGAIRIALGEDPGPLSPRWNRTSIEKAILAPPGRIRSITGVEAARGMPGVHQVFLNWKVGDVIKPPRNNVEKGGNVIVSGENYEEALSRVDAALAAIHIEREAGALPLSASGARNTPGRE
jgi:biotin carboxylase